jgi:antitoxin MazE
MKTTAKIVSIGNSRGVRLPKKMLEDLQLVDTVELESRGAELVIRPIVGPHAGWEESAQTMRSRGDDGLLLGELPASEWDMNEWKW